MIQNVLDGIQTKSVGFFEGNKLSRGEVHLRRKREGAQTVRLNRQTTGGLLQCQKCSINTTSSTKATSLRIPGALNIICVTIYEHSFNFINLNFSLRNWLFVQNEHLCKEAHQFALQ